MSIADGKCRDAIVDFVRLRADHGRRPVQGCDKEGAEVIVWSLVMVGFEE